MRNLIIITLVLLISGCSFAKKDKPAIVIGDIEVTRQEFQDALNSSMFRDAGQEGRQEFLYQFIARRLILKEAERLGLDRDPQFLKDIQLFWEQSLLKLALSQKIKELSVDIQVSDKEIRKYYSSNKETQFLEKELPEVYDQIKWVIINQKQQESITQWSESLKQGVKIDIDYKKLGLKEDE
ncbi:MAG: hypothetical protein KJ619_07085 [Candidatus Omnitrophica bacterium]|nr:hypothetical protein [Candidatus Omnitrophota bacterium]